MALAARLVPAAHLLCALRVPAAPADAARAQVCLRSVAHCNWAHCGAELLQQLCCCNCCSLAAADACAGRPAAVAAQPQAGVMA